MAQLAGVYQSIRQWIAGPSEGETSDGTLLRRFVDHKDESAFALLMERHGPMVMRVCRQVLQHTADAEDAFQASFLVLAKHARSIRRSESLSGWLYRVAFHIAVQTRGRAANRVKHEKQVATMQQQETAPTEQEWQEFLPAVHEEINGLPPQYRSPIVLCYLQGLSNEEAAQQLNCPVGTVKTRLSRGRDILRSRLARRGVALTSILLAGLMTQGVASAAVVPATLSASTLQAAVLVAAGQSAPVSAGVWSLVEGAQQALFASQVKVASVVLASVVAVSLGLGAGAALTYSNQSQPLAFVNQIDSEANANLGSGSADAVAVKTAVHTDGQPLAGVVTVYPADQATAAAGRSGTQSSRQDALSQQSPVGRSEQYQTRVAEFNLSQINAAQALRYKDAELLPMPAEVGTDQGDRQAVSGWWEWVWLPW